MIVTAVVDNVVDTTRLAAWMTADGDERTRPDHWMAAAEIAGAQARLPDDDSFKRKRVRPGLALLRRGGTFSGQDRKVSTLDLVEAKV